MGRLAPLGPVGAAIREVAPPVHQASMRVRHHLLLLSFLLCVILPSCVSAWYLWTRAADQYASTVGFTVRQEDGGSNISGLLGGLSQLSGTSISSDGDILYKYLQSQRLVAAVDSRLNLASIWAQPGDPVFGYRGDSIEDLVSYWKRMVRVAFDSSSGLIEVRVLAFNPEDATRITQTLFDDSSDMINEMSSVAQEDAIRFARRDLDDAMAHLKEVRQKLTDFRVRHQIADPTMDVETQGGLLANLQGQQAEAMIQLDLLKDTTRPDDPRIAQTQRKIDVIEARIADERARFGLGGADQQQDGEALADVIGHYRDLMVDQEFAEKSYVAAMASHDAALADARRKSRYLAAYAEPTRATTSRFPQRFTLQGLLTLFLFLTWAIAALLVYAIRDRR